MYGYVYKTTNIVNGKIYVGQKKSKIFLANKYLGSGKYLRCAIQHYGRQNFCVSLIATANTKEELDKLEKYYIKKFNSNDLTVGYNIAEGAVGGDTFSHLTDADKKLRIDKCLKSRKTNNKTYVAIHRGTENRRVEETVLPAYLKNGWKRGRSADWEKRLTDSRKGIKQSAEWVAKRVRTGWTDKEPEKYAEMIKKHRDSAIKQMANTPKEERVRRAKNANKFKGKKCCFVNNGKELHFIEQCELQEYLDKGFVLGMKKDGYVPSITGKIYVTNGVDNKQIIPSDLQKYIDLGYRRGLTRV